MSILLLERAEAFLEKGLLEQLFKRKEAGNDPQVRKFERQKSIDVLLMLFDSTLSGDRPPFPDKIR